MINNGLIVNYMDIRDKTLVETSNKNIIFKADEMEPGP